MPYIKIVDGKYNNPDALANALDYITSPTKTSGLVGGYNIIPEIAEEMMLQAKKIYGKTDGRQLVHIVYSLSPAEGQVITKEIMFEISRCIAAYFCKNQVVFSVHTFQNNLHTHFIINTISFFDGSKLITDKEFVSDFEQYCDWIFNGVVCKLDKICESGN